MTKLLVANGLKRTCGKQQVCGVTLYPTEYFCPKDFNTGKVKITENTRSIHHYTMSWKDDRAVWEHGVKKWLRNHGVSEPSAYLMASAAGVLRFGDVHAILRWLGIKRRS